MPDMENMGPRCKYCGRWTFLIQFSPRLKKGKPMTVCEYCDRYHEQRAPQRSHPTK